MTDYAFRAEAGHIKFSRVSFSIAARQYLSCFEGYAPTEFSPLKYFLSCRAIELALKALHLDTKSVKEVKDEIGHNLVRAYDRLEQKHQTLSDADRQLLSDVSRLYDVRMKAFEYIQPIHAAHAYSDFPDLSDLYELARKIVEYVECYQKENA